MSLNCSRFIVVVIYVLLICYEIGILINKVSSNDLSLLIFVKYTGHAIAHSAPYHAPHHLPNTSVTILNRIVGFLIRVQALRILILYFCFFFKYDKAHNVHDKDLQLSQLNHETSYTIIGSWLFQKTTIPGSILFRIVTEVLGNLPNTSVTRNSRSI